MAKLCKDCGQPMLPKGAVKLLNEYDHAQGCPSDPAQKRRELAELIWRDAVLAYYRHTPGANDNEEAVAAIERVLAEQEGK